MSFRPLVILTLYRTDWDSIFNFYSDPSNLYWFLVGFVLCLPFLIMFLVFAEKFQEESEQDQKKHPNAAESRPEHDGGDSIGGINSRSKWLALAAVFSFVLILAVGMFMLADFNLTGVPWVFFAIFGGLGIIAFSEIAGRREDADVSTTEILVPIITSPFTWWNRLRRWAKVTCVIGFIIMLTPVLTLGGLIFKIVGSPTLDGEKDYLVRATNSAIYRAVKQEDTKRVRELLNADHEFIDRVTYNKEYYRETRGALLLAIKKYRNDLVSLLLSEGDLFNSNDDFDVTAIIHASRRGNLSALKKLVDHGARVNERGDGGYTPLMMASAFGHIKVVRYLIDEGADLNTRGVRDGTALGMAGGRGHFQVVRLLLEHGADPVTVKQLGSIPHVNDKRTYKSYQKFLKADRHKAFAISKQNYWAWSEGLSSPKAAKQRALDICEGDGEAKCEIYAVNDRVLWWDQFKDTDGSNDKFFGD